MFALRQDAVKELEQRQPVALVKEPDNKFDASAVRVETLCGAATDMSFRLCDVQFYVNILFLINRMIILII
jgi:hypothetical protein